jgi:hypothetical protein
MAEIEICKVKTYQYRVKPFILLVKKLTKQGNNRFTPDLTVDERHIASIFQAHW